MATDLTSEITLSRLSLADLDVSLALALVDAIGIAFIYSEFFLRKSPIKYFFLKKFTF